jgi:hypothetical protein
MKSDWRANQFHAPHDQEDKPDGFVSVAILVFAVAAPLIYFGPQLGAVEGWFMTDTARWSAG